MNARPNQFIGCDRPFAEARVVLFGAPYDSTTSFRPGTRFGPSAMRSESFGIETYSMLQDRDIAEDAAVFDSGDLELPFGAPDRALEMIEARESEILGAGKIPFLLGGEHLVTLGAMRAAVKRHPDLRIVHFDAHADLREDYLGVELSHACVLRRCHDLLGDGRIFQFGIRSGTGIPGHGDAGGGRAFVHAPRRRCAPDLRETQHCRARQRGTFARARSDWTLHGARMQIPARGAAVRM